MPRKQQAAEEQMRKFFRAAHHPDSPLRQFVEWQRRGPRNPPQFVKDMVAVNQQITKETFNSTPSEMRERIAKGD